MDRRRAGCARSIGGGEVEITQVDGRPVLFNGAAHESLVEVAADHADAARELLTRDGLVIEAPASGRSNGRVPRSDSSLYQ